MIQSYRRQTLGSINSNQLFARNQARNSISGTAKSNFSNAPRNSISKPTAVGRNSIQSKSARKSSILNVNPSKIFLDPRPIKDKVYFKSVVLKVAKFLALHNYPNTIKNLSAPSTVEVQSIFYFIVSFFDENISFDNKKFEDDVINYLKFLRYPFAHTLSRKSLSCAGAPHTWPSVLCAINWLIELIEYNMASSEDNNNLEVPELKNAEKDSDKFLDDNTMFISFLSTAYEDFLNGNNSDWDQLLEQRFSARNQQLSNQIEELQYNNNIKKSQIDELEKHKDPIPDLKTRLNLEQSGKEKLIEDNNAIEKEISLANEKYLITENQLIEIKADIEKLEKEKNSLEKSISEQKVSPEELQKMVQEKDLLTEHISKTTKNLSKVTQDCWEKEIEISKVNDSLEKKVYDFNRFIRELQTTMSLKELKQFDEQLYSTELTLDFQQENLEKILSLDLKNDIKPLFDKIQEIVDLTKKNARKNHTLTLALVEQSSLVLSEKNEAIPQLELQLSKLEEIYKTEKNNSLTEINEIDSKIDDIELLNRKILHEIQSKSITDDEIDRLKKDYFADQNLFKEIEEKLHKEACEAMKILSQHRSYVTEILTQLCDRSVLLKSDIEAIKMKSNK